MGYTQGWAGVHLGKSLRGGGGGGGKSTLEDIWGGGDGGWAAYSEQYSILKG